MARISPLLRGLTLLCALVGARAGLWCDETTVSLNKVRVGKLAITRALSAPLTWCYGGGGGY